MRLLPNHVSFYSPLRNMVVTILESSKKLFGTLHHLIPSTKEHDLLPDWKVTRISNITTARMSPAFLQIITSTNNFCAQFLKKRIRSTCNLLQNITCNLECNHVWNTKTIGLKHCVPCWGGGMQWDLKCKDWNLTITAKQVSLYVGIILSRARGAGSPVNRQSSKPRRDTVR